MTVFCSFFYYTILTVGIDESKNCTDHSFYSKAAKESFQMNGTEDERTLNLPMKKER